MSGRRRRRRDADDGGGGAGAEGRVAAAVVSSSVAVADAVAVAACVWYAAIVGVAPSSVAAAIATGGVCLGVRGEGFGGGVCCCISRSVVARRNVCEERERELFFCFLNETVHTQYIVWQLRKLPVGYMKCE